MSDSVPPHRQQLTRLPHPWDSPGKNTGVGCHFLLQGRKVKSESEVTQSCLTLSDLMDCGPPGSSVHGILQARVLEWGAIAFSMKKNRCMYNWITSLYTWNWNNIVNQFYSINKIKILNINFKNKVKKGNLVHKSMSIFVLIHFWSGSCYILLSLLPFLHLILHFTEFLHVNLEPNMKQWTDSKLGKEYVKAVTLLI